MQHLHSGQGNGQHGGLVAEQRNELAHKESTEVSVAQHMRTVHAPLSP
jgi:hypothetical protein